MSDIAKLFDELSAICKKLEKGPSLEMSVELYARGVEIQKFLQEELGRAERRVVEIISSDGSIKPFTTKNSRK